MLKRIVDWQRVTTMNSRWWFLALALLCGGLMAYALYLQYVELMEPCPLCMLQRLVVVGLAAVSLVAAIHHPHGLGRWLYAGLNTLLALAGMALSLRHIWIQALPADKVPQCGPGLNYMLDTMPWMQVILDVLRGSGECAHKDYVFGVTIPVWTLLFFVAILLVSMLTVRMRGR
jgi:disulfide bond formation protein DsbB